MICAHYACVVDCADAMADAWEDTAGCAQTICLHENLLKCQCIVVWDWTGSCTYERRLCSEYAHECGYSQYASLCNYSFLVRQHVSSKSLVCTWKKYTLITSSGMTDAEHPACMHTVSAICVWATVLVYNRSHPMLSFGFVRVMHS